MKPESLTPERWQQIEQLWSAALERRSDERAAFLAEACAGDEDLRREVESLLRFDLQADSFIETPALEVAARLESEVPPRSLAGQRLDHYQITSLLGAGGMGEVWRARDAHLDREVAVKVLPAHLAQDGGALARFQREARAVAALSHPNILAIHDFGADQGISYAVTELLEGETLRARLEHTAMSWRRAVEIGLAVADGLAAAHAKGIIHRDLKPENIFLTTAGQVKILDFGLARIKPVRASAEQRCAVTGDLLTSPGTILGTIGYMSPEQVRGDEVDAPGDIFLLGCVLYEMVTGCRAFARATTVEEMNAILKEAPPEMADSPRYIPPELQSIISHCLEKRPEDRFRSAPELAVALKAIPLETERASPFHKPARSTSRRLLLIAGALLLLVPLLLFFSGLSDWFGRKPIRSIAVLPLKNFSQSPAEDYFADGMTDELISSLMKVGSLRVISRTSVMRYRETGQSLSEIARELKVDAVVEGSVRRAGEKMQINVRLFRSASEQPEWSQTYVRELRDILVLQSQVAQDIAREIHIQTTPQEQARLTQAATVNPAALQLYFTGRYFLAKRTPEGFREGRNYFQQAIATEPDFALAYSGLADSYILGGDNAEMPKAGEAASTALRLDDSLAEAHTSLAAVKMLDEWNWPEAESGFKRAIDLKPGYGTAHLWYAEFLTAMGRHEEAIAAIKRALESDPNSLTVRADTGRHYFYARQYDQAIASLRNTLELDPKYTGVWTFLGLTYVKQKKFDDAFAMLARARELAPANSNTMAALGYAYAQAGRRDEAGQILDRLLELSRREPVSPYWLAVVEGSLGRKDEAFTWLETAFEKRSSQLVYLKVLPTLDDLRSDHRFQSLVQRVGLPDAAYPRR